MPVVRILRPFLWCLNLVAFFVLSLEMSFCHLLTLSLKHPLHPSHCLVQIPLGNRGLSRIRWKKNWEHQKTAETVGHLRGWGHCWLLGILSWFLLQCSVSSLTKSEEITGGYLERSLSVLWTWETGGLIFKVPHTRDFLAQKKRKCWFV